MKRTYSRRISQTSSPKMRHIQSKENFENYHLLDQIEEKCRQAQNMKLNTIKRRSSQVKKKNLETKQRLDNYYQIEKKTIKEKDRMFKRNRVELEDKINDHMKTTVLHQQQAILRKKMKYESSTHNKKGEIQNASKKLRQLMVKMKHNENNIKQCKFREMIVFS